jgi:hypothetical protein
MPCQFCKGDHTGHGWHEFEGTELVFRPAPLQPTKIEDLPDDWFYYGMSCGKTPAGINCVAVTDYGMACGPCRSAHTCNCQEAQPCDTCNAIYGN